MVANKSKSLQKKQEGNKVEKEENFSFDSIEEYNEAFDKYNEKFLEIRNQIENLKKEETDVIKILQTIHNNFKKKFKNENNYLEEGEEDLMEAKSIAKKSNGSLDVSSDSKE